jgi:hypothetical protein
MKKDDSLRNSNLTPEPDNSADNLLKKAEIFERHHHLGHFKYIDGLKMASELRDRARRLNTDN